MEGLARDLHQLGAVTRRHAPVRDRAGVNARRLAAIDMYGTRGTARRKRIILAEFTTALAATVALGTWLVIGASGLGTRMLGIWLIGAGLNYAPLAAFAISLSRPGALEAELANVDTGREMRRYCVLQLWILVPLSLIAMTVPGRNPAPDQLRMLDASLHQALLPQLVDRAPYRAPRQLGLLDYLTLGRDTSPGWYRPDSIRPARCPPVVDTALPARSDRSCPHGRTQLGKACMSAPREHPWP